MFVIIQMHYVIQMYFELYMKNVKVDLYEKMAYTDALTGIANRAALDRADFPEVCFAGVPHRRR